MTPFASAGAAGTFRSDMETADVVRALDGLLRLDADGEWKGQAGRQTTLLMDGPHTGAPARAAGRGPER